MLADFKRGLKNSRRIFGIVETNPPVYSCGGMNETTRRVLLTGFEPFNGGNINPSELIVNHLHCREIHGFEIAGRILPCCFDQATRDLKRHMKRIKPAIVICLGQAGGRAGITPERIAINIADADIPDNAGKQPVDKPVIRGGPAAYVSTLPIKAIVSAIRSHDIPASVSNSAGTFVCNHVFYGLMHELRETPAVRGGFVHVPFLPKQAGRSKPRLALKKMLAGIEEAIRVSITTAK